MNKAVMIPIQPKFSKMIIDGTKQFEFRNYAIPKGTKVYLYESLGKKKDIILWEDNPLYICWRDDGGQGKMLDYITEGQGKVVAEFVVGRVWGENNRNPLAELYDEAYYGCNLLSKYKDKLEQQGHTNQKYAMEITNLIVYDEEPVCVTCKEEKGDYHKYNCRKYGMMKQNCIKYEQHKNKPTEPLDISEFVGWNKLEKYPLAECGTKFSECYKCDMDNECSIQINGREDCKLTHAPQGKVYVVERD